MAARFSMSSGAALLLDMAPFCPKLTVAGCPEVSALLSEFEELVRSGLPPRGLAYGFALLSGIRGLHGVQWLGPRLRTMLPALAWTSPCEVAPVLAKIMSEFTQESDGRPQTWAAHAEGRHAGLSGGHFLAAACQEESAKGLWSTAISLEGHVEQILRHDSRALSDQQIVQLLRAFMGKMVLAIREKPGRPRKICSVGGYNAMSMGRNVILWAYATERARSHGPKTVTASIAIWMIM